MRTAFSLLEVTIVLTILGFLFTGVVQSLSSGTMLVQSISSRADLVNSSHQAVHTLANEMRSAASGEIVFIDDFGTPQVLEDSFIYASESGDLWIFSFLVPNGLIEQDDLDALDWGTLDALQAYYMDNFNITIPEPAIGMPHYTIGSRRRIEFDRLSGELALYTEDDSGLYWKQVLTNDLTPSSELPAAFVEAIQQGDNDYQTIATGDLPAFAVTPMKSSVLAGNYLTLHMSKRTIDYSTNTAVDNYVTRRVFLRSTNFNTEGLGATGSDIDLRGDSPEQTPPPSEPEELTAGEPVGQADTIEQPAETVTYSEPTIAWGSIQSGKGNKYDQTITLGLPPGGYSVDSIETSFSGSNPNNFSATQTGNLTVQLSGQTGKSANLTLTVNLTAPDGSTHSHTESREYNY